MKALLLGLGGRAGSEEDSPQLGCWSEWTEPLGLWSTCEPPLAHIHKSMCFPLIYLNKSVGSEALVDI